VTPSHPVALDPFGFTALELDLEGELGQRASDAA